MNSKLFCYTVLALVHNKLRNVAVSCDIYLSIEDAEEEWPKDIHRHQVFAPLALYRSPVHPEESSPAKSKRSSSAKTQRKVTYVQQTFSANGYYVNW